MERLEIQSGARAIVGQAIRVGVLDWYQKSLDEEIIHRSELENLSVGESELKLADGFLEQWRQAIIAALEERTRDEKKVDGSHKEPETRHEETK